MAPPNCLVLPAAFFERDTLTVARALLGCQLLKYELSSNAWLACPIVETEAYTEEDPACHAYNRTTGRAAALYGNPGTAYVYLIYGIYDCLNVVTEKQGTAGAVLFRAVMPPLGSGLKTSGPGRLTKALRITKSAFNGRALTQWDSGLCLAAGTIYPDEAVVQTTRIGIRKAVDYPWRFYVKDSPWVSVREKSFKLATEPG
ncbi:DNA-3-methyladenine glycosylase [Vampirovibrio sp.]|uniref:DNA-3-methyladenine glycosylase n=1 Tax=Vampirovibrio sp. TaxID=2717857 RepID=UPI003592FBA5